MELFKDITKEWKREDWNELNHILIQKYNGLIDSHHFLEQFDTKFESSNWGYAHVSFGYETTVYIPFVAVCKYEMLGDTEKNKTNWLSLSTKLLIA